MPLFKCQCGVIENTALGDFWPARMREREPKCSQCAKGKWHGRFDRKSPEEWGVIEGQDGFYYSPADIQPGGYLSHVTKPKDLP